MKQTYRIHADDVFEIKRELFIGALYQSQIAEKFGLSQSFVSAIKRGKVWRHIEFTPTDADRKARDAAKEAHKADVLARRKEARRKANAKQYPRRLEALRLGREIQRQRDADDPPA